MSAQIAGTGARAGTATAPSQGTGVAGDETGASGGAASQARPRKATYPGFRATLKLVGTGSRGSRDLSFDEACDALGALLRAEATSAQAGAFLIATRIKGESPEELAGYAQALRDAAEPMSALTDRPLVACAGAYDGSLQAPHLSLAAAIVAGACGAGIVVHCGPRLGPKYGVSARDVLAALGAPRSPTRAQSEAMLARAGVTVVDTSRAVQGWNALTRLRNEVGLRGPVHSAEKLLDYFGARRFVVGYTHSAYAGRLLGALALLGAERALAVRGTEGPDGLDEAPPRRAVRSPLRRAVRSRPRRAARSLRRASPRGSSTALTTAPSATPWSSARRCACTLPGSSATPATASTPQTARSATEPHSRRCKR